MTMTRSAVPCLLISLAATVGAASTASVPERMITPATVVMEFPGRFGAMQRPPVEFDHAVHTQALELEGCPTCHPRDGQGDLIPQLEAARGIDDRDQLIDAYHGVCIDCHTRRAASSQKAGPVTCGECHVKRTPGVSQRAAMTFDYSLHARHAKALADKCETCHHVYDEAARQLRYEMGKEEACRSCHGAVDVERNLSLENTSHRACVSCHLRRAAAGEKGGPTQCVGCHDLEHQAAFLELEEIPRLMRGQPDTVWVHDAAAKFPSVGFDHRAHEPLTRCCSSCHHRTLAACDTCHTLTGAVEGSGVTLARSYHHGSSVFSCVGCHRVASNQQRCAGCHQALKADPADSSCVVCHSGPSTEEGVLAAPPAPTEPRLDALPACSDEFPETVTIDSLAADYEASKLPHAKIAAKLDAEVRASSLAVRFHGETATLCAGCHHHSPVGSRPPACRSCHSASAEPTSDQPGLKAAYHRQCLGCHIRMGIPKQGCTDCHASKEVQP
jgi:hypothetical protein